MASGETIPSSRPDGRSNGNEARSPTLMADGTQTLLLRSPCGKPGLGVRPAAALYAVGRGTMEEGCLRSCTLHGRRSADRGIGADDCSALHRRRSLAARELRTRSDFRWVLWARLYGL